MSAPADKLVHAAAANFLAAFEQVFHTDWSYTKSQLGIDDQSQTAGRAALLALMCEDSAGDSHVGTFLQPGRAIEGENWGNYESLLQAYAALKQLLDRLDPAGAA